MLIHDLNLLVGAGVAAKDVQDTTRMLKSLAAVITLYHADHLWCNLACIFQSTDLQQM